jgi:recombination protein RecA
MKSNEIIDILKSVGALSDQPNEDEIEYVSTGSHMINWVCSDDFKKGLPIGSIVELIGETSVGKSYIAQIIVKEAQSKGWICAYLDNEGTLNKSLANKLGINVDTLIYPDLSNVDTIEKCFSKAEEVITKVREINVKTPIVIVLDSLGTATTEKELAEEMTDENNMGGAIRAKTIGRLLRKINPIVRKQNVLFILVNQVRHKAGVVFGSPETRAGGGRSLEYYVNISLQIASNKSSDILKDNDVPYGIVGEVRNKKNKNASPFRTCPFKIVWNKGLDPNYGLTKFFVGTGELIAYDKGWFSLPNSSDKFRESAFEDKLLNDPSFKTLREKLS